MRLAELLPPPKFSSVLHRKREPLAILDIGCGNNSATVTKKWLPNCVYFGLDNCRYNNNDEDYALMEQLFEVDLRTSDLKCIPNQKFDLIILSHVIEHLENGLDVLTRLVPKLRENGNIYIEFPSARSLELPSGVNCLNFHDDPTHVRVYSPQEVEACLRDGGCQILRSGTRREPYRMVLSIATMPLQLWFLLKYGKPNGPLLWDILGFADYVLAASKVSS